MVEVLDVSVITLLPKKVVMFFEYIFEKIQNLLLHKQVEHYKDIQFINLFYLFCFVYFCNYIINWFNTGYIFNTDI